MYFLRMYILIETGSVFILGLLPQILFFVFGDRTDGGFQIFNSRRDMLPYPFLSYFVWFDLFIFFIFATIF